MFPFPGNRDSDSHHGDRGRGSNMGPPPGPSHSLKQDGGDGGMQLPPQLSQVSPDTSSRCLSSRDSIFSPSESSAGLPPPTLTRLPPQSPALSHTSLSLVSPAAASNLPVNYLRFVRTVYTVPRSGLIAKLQRSRRF